MRERERIKSRIKVLQINIKISPQSSEQSSGMSTHKRVARASRKPKLWLLISIIKMAKAHQIKCGV